MKDLETAEDVLASARAGLDPSPVARARVRESLLQRAAALGAVGTVTAVKSAAAGTIAGGSGTSLVMLTKVFASSFVLAAAGATTVVVGVESVTGSAQSVAPSNRMELRAPAPVTGGVRPTRDASTPKAPERVLESPAPEPRAPEPPAPARISENRAAIGDQREATAAPPKADLEGEFLLLQGAREAVTNGRTQRARQLLAQLDQRYPAGLLVEERSALRVVADCPGAPDSLRARLGNQFLTAYPRSVYAARVQLACRPSAESRKALTDPPPRGH